MRRNRVTGFLCALGLASACGAETTTKVAETQLLLTVDAEPALRAQTSALRVSLSVEQPSGYAPRPSVTVADPRWPVDIPIIASDERDASARFELVVEALASDGTVAQTRLLTRFEPGERARVAAALRLCAGPDPVCSPATCHGSACLVCGPSGACEPVPTIAPRREPSVSEPDGGDEVDAMQGAADASVPPASSDAGSSPAADAASADAAKPMSSCPADHGCSSIYPCVPTAKGYTCRGQFADWPMPDSTPGAKHAPSLASDSLVVSDAVTKLQWQTAIPQVLAGCTQYSRPSSGGAGPIGEFCTLPEARRYCDELVHGGHDDWRLPSFIELASLLDLGNDDKRYAIATAFFGLPEWSGFVTTSIYPSMPAYMRGVDFISRETSSTEYGQVRCVRGGAEPPFARPAERYLVDATAGAVTDQATGLVWQRSASATPYTREQIDASSQCPAGFRLPTPNELLTLIDPTKSKPAIDVAAFPGTPAAAFWAARPSERNVAVSFELGDLETYAMSAHVRCVR